MAATVAPPQDPITIMLSSLALREKQRFHGSNMVIGAATRVHSVGYRTGLAGLQFPVPGCGQGWNGLGADPDLHPTRDAVTCLRCRWRHITGRAAPRLSFDPAQLAFDLD